MYFLTENLVGAHDAPIRCVEYCPEVNVMVTGSWDQTVKLWDPRTPCNAGTFSQPEKVCTGCRILGDTSSDWLNIAVQDTVLNLIELKKLCLMISKV